MYKNILIGEILENDFINGQFLSLIPGEYDSTVGLKYNKNKT